MSRYSWAAVVVIFASLYLAIASHVPGDQIHPTAAELQYSRAHSLGDGYTFDPRDGWQTINVSNLNYKYSPRSPNIRKNTKTADLPNKLMSKLNGLAGVGKAEDVIITWYTGHDLLNPSCWENPVWAPTDKSFACALTQEGWTSKPKCFKFIELCNGPTKCVFVRVVDSCAGCAKGSSHVDVTKAAFSQLENLDRGILSVKMRPASDPLVWFENLWGPKHRK